MFETICARAGGRCKQILEPTIELAIEIAREGREGHRIGTIFTLGDSDILNQPWLLRKINHEEPHRFISAGIWLSLNIVSVAVPRASASE
jgi:DNA integrity scanning protein DisA with diadenylate cyclase activity